MEDLSHKENPVGILLIAAGKGLRFAAAGGETDKLQAQFCDAAGNQRTMFAHACHAALQSQLPVCVVTRPAQHAIRKFCQQHHIPVVLVDNSRMGESIAAGVRSMSRWQGWLIHLADMPFIRSDTLRQVADKIVADGIIRPVYRGQAGHPVGFGRDTLEALSQLESEQGARSLLTRFPLYTFEVDDAAILQDIDLPSQLPGGK